MMREILEIVMLLSLLGGLFFVNYEFKKDKQERLRSDKADNPESGN
ncbi:MAG: hypothetical protein M0R33_20265 [Methylomonas sp.]|nr:hypothetical protein [Methylomonas sp.]MCK9608780.1 hypothetical protein [Methylomonas sp.]